MAGWLEGINQCVNMVRMKYVLRMKYEHVLGMREKCEGRAREGGVSEGGWLLWWWGRRGGGEK